MPVPNGHKPFASRERRGINKNCLAKRCTIEEKQLQDELGMAHVRAGDRHERKVARARPPASIPHDLVDSLSRSVGNSHTTGRSTLWAPPKGVRAGAPGQDHVVVTAKDRAVGYVTLSCGHPEGSPPL